MDFLTETAETSGMQVGTCVILPSSFQGGQRNTREQHHDTTAIMSKYGHPGLCITDEATVVTLITTDKATMIINSHYDAHSCT